jgi:hypothetical protein
MKSRYLLIPLVVCLILSMATSTIAIFPASAKNLNWPSNIYKIDYYNAAGDADIVLPSPLPTNYPTFGTPPQTINQMRLRAVHVEMPNADLSYNTLLVFFYDSTKAAAGKDPWQPYAEITDGSATVAAFERTFWKGTYLEFDATLYNYPPQAPPNLRGTPLPASWSTDNVIVVDKGVLTIGRNGNNIVVTLKDEQTIKKALATTSFKLPPFSLEIASYGHASHTSDSVTMLGWSGATGYTIAHDDLRFDANGVFASEGTYLNGISTFHANVVMKGTHTFYNPAPT